MGHVSLFLLSNNYFWKLEDKSWIDLLLQLFGAPELTTTVLNRVYEVLISNTGTVG